MNETDTYESAVDRFRRQLQTLAWSIQSHVEASDYTPAERLDWLDLERIALEMLSVVHNHMQFSEEDVHSSRHERWTERQADMYHWRGLNHVR